MQDYKEYLLYKRKRGFTLAEVLIALGVIGIIAAITVPAIIQNQQERSTVSALKKADATLSQAYLRAKSKYGEPNNWTASTGGAGASAFFNKMKEFLNVSLNCARTAGLGCFAKGVNYHNLDNSTTSILDNQTSYDKIKLADGISMLFMLNTNACTDTGGSSLNLKNSICGSIYVDINSDKDPNVLGKDTFGFYVTKYGIVPLGTPADNLPFETSCDSFSEFCTAWVLYIGNMDYLKCFSSLSWSGAHTCP